MKRKKEVEREKKREGGKGKAREQGSKQGIKDSSDVSKLMQSLQSPSQRRGLWRKKTKRCLLTCLKIFLDPCTHFPKITAWLTHSLLICELISSNVH